MPENIKNYKYQLIGNDFRYGRIRILPSCNYICPGGIGFAGWFLGVLLVVLLVVVIKTFIDKLYIQLQS